MENRNTDLLPDIAEYYSSKLAQYGETPRGVDWNGEEGQVRRFEQLSKIIREVDAFSINDLGCGYGAFYDYLKREYKTISYLGIDISMSMVRAAEQLHRNDDQVRFLRSGEPDRIADFGVASGIFNVRLDRPNDAWLANIEATLDILNRTSRLGFSFNCLTSYSDLDKMRAYLYYADPCALFDMCMRRYSRNVALLHDYGLYEFTILVRKQ